MSVKPAATRRGRRPKAVAPVLRKQPAGKAAPTFDAVIVAAQRVLEQHGVEGLSTNRIAETAGVSIGSLYQYFPNKEAVVSALTDRYFEAIMSAVLPVLAGPTDDPLVVLSRVGAALCEAYERLPPIHRHLRDLRAAAGKHSSYDGMLDNLIASVGTYLEGVGVHEPQIAAFVVVSVVDGCIMSFTTRQLPFDVRRLAAELELVLGPYLATRGQTRPAGRATMG